jgi:prepilin-type N-terminal cleavage/methylation domain-containing protein
VRRRDGLERFRENAIETTDKGFTLLEVLVALVLVTITAAGVAGLFSVAIRDARAARDQTMTALLAVAKMEELRGLTWSFDGSTGAPLSDLTTDLSRSPPDGSGAGLSSSGAGVLERHTAGYVDYLDAGGRWVGNGVVAPPEATYVRRWQVEPLPAAPDSLVLRVLVTTVLRDAVPVPAGQARSRRPDETLLVSVRTRKAG